MGLRQKLSESKKSDMSIYESYTSPYTSDSTRRDRVSHTGPGLYGPMHPAHPLQPYPPDRSPIPLLSSHPPTTPPNYHCATAPTATPTPHGPGAGTPTPAPGGGWCNACPASVSGGIRGEGWWP
jgi:hypothetical protein